MDRTPKHGQRIRLEDVLEMINRSKNLFTSSPFRLAEIELTNYDYLFQQSADDPATKLDPTASTIAGLRALGAAMRDDGAEAPSGIPAAYTYLGQFVDHDITLLAESDLIRDELLTQDLFQPIQTSDLRSNIKNTRTATFDLDSVYDNAPTDNGLLKIGQTSPVGNKPPGKGTDNDLPRAGGVPVPDGKHRKALIGDARNDENLIVAQLHLAFLKFHNAIQTQTGMSFDDAKRTVRQHYQWLILHDFLDRICDNQIVNDIRTNGNRFYNPSDDDFFIPIEFTTAAYRFGHSMIRTNYNINANFLPATLTQLFQFTGLSGDMAGLDTLPENWIIEWDNLLPFNANKDDKAMKINTHLTVILQQLPNQRAGILQSLAKRNLLRGYLLNIPVGQALASEALDPGDVLTPAQILGNANAEERQILENNNFHVKTPLWYYILAEAAIQQNGDRLGKLGSVIVGETIVGLIARSKDSILQIPGWQPTLANPFTLESLIDVAGLGPTTV